MTVAKKSCGANFKCSLLCFSREKLLALCDTNRASLMQQISPNFMKGACHGTRVNHTNQPLLHIIGQLLFESVRRAASTMDQISHPTVYLNTP